MKDLVKIAGLSYVVIIGLYFLFIGEDKGDILWLLPFVFYFIVSLLIEYSDVKENETLEELQGRLDKGEIKIVSRDDGSKVVRIYLDCTAEELEAQDSITFRISKE